MQYTLARSYRANAYEEWTYYFNTKYRNKVLIIWGENLNKLYLFSEHNSDLQDTMYLNEVINLVHDLPVNFDLKTECLSEDLFDQRIEQILLSEQVW